MFSIKRRVLLAAILMMSLGTLFTMMGLMLVEEPTEVYTAPLCNTPSSTEPVVTAEVPEYKIPNIVHYIWHNTDAYPLEFHHLLSILSAFKVLQPDVIYFHTSFPPIGIYWEQAKKLPRFKVMQRSPPTKLYGEDVQPPKFYTSHSNVDRVVILQEYGGVYLDLDTIVIRPFDDLRRAHDCVIGLEQDDKACGCIILCSKESFFLTLWINSYLDDYRMDEWAYNTGKVPAKLARRYPSLVHVEETKMNHPNFNELDVIWGPNTWKWTDNYSLHMWYRLYKDRSEYFTGVIPDEYSIRQMNNTFGKIARSLYYGTPDLLY